MPREMAKVLTIPEQVTNYNYEYLTRLIDAGKINTVIKKDKEKIVIPHYVYTNGTILRHGDVIIRQDKNGNDIEFVVNNCKEVLKPGDRLKRNGEFITNIKYPQKRRYPLEIGDICERQLMDKKEKIKYGAPKDIWSDIVLLNRQPTLHTGSMLAQEIVLTDNKTLTFNLAIAKSFNADYDGDEIIFVSNRWLPRLLSKIQFRINSVTYSLARVYNHLVRLIAWQDSPIAGSPLEL